MTNFLSLLSLLAKHKEYVRRLLVDGSFVTSKPSPGDLDIILILASDFNFDSPEAIALLQAKADLNIHLISLSEEDPLEVARWIGFFGHDRDQAPRGLLEVSE